MSEQPAGRGPPQRIEQAGQSDDVDVPVKRRVSRRLAFWTAGTALVLGGVALAALNPYQHAEAERVAADHIGLLAEAVAAAYEQDEPTPKKKAAKAPDNGDDDIEREIDVVAPGALGAGQSGTARAPGADVAGDVEQEHVHRAREILKQLQRADGVVAIDVADHRGVVRQSTKQGRIGTTQKPPHRLRESHVDGDALTVSYAIPFTHACASCHDARQDPVGAVHVVVDKAAAFSSLDRYRTVMGFVLIGTYVVLVLLIIAVADRIVGKPAHALARLMKRAERGDFLVRARVSGDDELGALAMAFNRMLRSITSMKVDELETSRRLLAAEAELTMKEELALVAERLQQSNAALERRVRAQELLMEAAHRLGSTLDKAALLERLCRVIREKLGRQDFLIYLVVEAEDREARLEVARASGLLDRDDVRGRRFRVGEGITGLVAETGAPLLVHDLKNPFERTAVPPAVQTTPLIEEGSLVAVPMLHKGRVVGVFEFYDPEIGAFDDDDGKLLEALGAQAAMAVVNADLYQTTLELSVTDSLTKLMNRRALNRLLDAELERARRFNTPLAVLMLDVDHFKNYNDRMGHLLGDEALKAVAYALSQSVRKVDAVARFGGEEFCVVLPRTDEQAGVEVADKLLKAIRALDVAGHASQPLGHLSISVGVAVYPDDMPPAFDEAPIKVLVDVADQAAYEAKRRGRDRVVSAGEARPKKPKLEPGPVKKDLPTA